MNTMASQYRTAKLEAMIAQISQLKTELLECHAQNHRETLKNFYDRANQDLLVARISVLELRAKLLEMEEV